MQLTTINYSQVWAQLFQHQRATRHMSMRDLFDSQPDRFDQMHLTLDGLLFDYSKNRITARTIELLCELADTAALRNWMQRMQCGEHINISEDRAVLHTAFRLPAEAQPQAVDGKNIVALVHNTLDRCYAFAESVRSGYLKGYSGKAITDVVNLGIGGSDLGPRMVAEALKPYHHDRLRVHFVANIDGAHLSQLLEQLDPATTLFIIASKSFTTPETLLNAATARQWLVQQADDEAVALHFAAVSCNVIAAKNFGLVEENVFPMPNWVGGRFSVWSAIGLPVMLAIGSEKFAEFLAGGYAADQHFYEAPFEQNIPVLMALIGIWYNTFYGAHTHTILPYDHGLRFLPSHLQQLDMESNGKRVGRTGERLDFDTAPVIWGEEGVNCQHAFLQLLHQGTRLVPCDFIVPINSHYEVSEHQSMLVANALAQAEALMRGKTEAEVMEEIGNSLSGEQLDLLLPQKLFPGNQPSNMFLLDKLTPHTLGILLALYEHRVFVQGVIWGINSFDQWGVEYGKQLAHRILPQLNGDCEPRQDVSTNGLINYFREHHVRGR